jgi:Ala-tRNA(Pro) deacylase
MIMNGDPRLYEILDELGIEFEYHEHPPGPTVEEALKYWKDIDSAHCKNIFFRNHKGNRHYLVISDHRYQLDIHDLEKRLKQGKLSFASSKRMMKYLGIEPGSVSLFGLINDSEDHVYLFIDENLLKEERISFHPNINTASLVISMADMKKFLGWSGNGYEFIGLYD